MEITVEMVERLREKAPVSYAQAKEALEYSEGNLLDALIYLEEQGAIPRPQGAYYSTRNETPPPPPSQEELAPLGEKTDGTEQRKKKKFKGMGVKVVSGKTLFGTLRRWLIDNELEIWRRGQPVTSLPILVLIVLVLFAPWVSLPLLLLGLFFWLPVSDLRPGSGGRDHQRRDGQCGRYRRRLGPPGDGRAEKTQHDKYNNRKK